MTYPQVKQSILFFIECFSNPQTKDKSIEAQKKGFADAIEAKYIKLSKSEEAKQEIVEAFQMLRKKEIDADIAAPIVFNAITPQYYWIDENGNTATSYKKDGGKLFGWKSITEQQFTKINNNFNTWFSFI